MIIDFSAHVIPPELEGRFSVKFSYSPNLPQDRLSLMKDYGIAAQVVHLSAAQLSRLDAKESAEICRISNDYIYENLSSKYPDRFIGCGIVSILDADAALEEIDRVKGLGFRCITVPTHQGNRGLDHSESRKILRRAAELEFPVFIHPADWEGNPFMDRGSMNAVGWPFDTSLAVWRMMVGGVLDEIPSLKIVLHHMGAMIPFFRYRINQWLKKYAKLNKRLEDYAKQIYVDTAIEGGSVADLMVAYSLFGPKRILFGSDWPYVEARASIGENLAAIRAAPISDEEKDMILGKNVMDLLKI